MDLDVAALATLEIVALGGREVGSPVDFGGFIGLFVEVLRFGDVFDGVEHAVEGLADGEEVFGVLPDPEGVVEALVEEVFLGVGFEDLQVVEGVVDVVLEKLFVLLESVHELALFDEAALGAL